MVDIGRIALVLTFLVAVLSVGLSAVSTRINSHRLFRIVRYSVTGIAILYTSVLIILIIAFITRDFSFAIVAEHASKSLSPLYAVSALYADKAGSILLWGWFISVFSAIIANQRVPSGTVKLSWTLTILVTIQTFFLIMATFLANVFAKNPNPPGDGLGLNPLLQNTAMLVHPPMLYISFAAVSVAFALVMAAIITRTPSAQWLGRVRSWTLLGWGTLGLGNLIGMWWSYNELGWGGYWAWDPVENAGLMPWLLITAAVHSLSIQRQREHMSKWSVYLIIFTFVFTLLIPFITHGGIESPLHGFIGSSFPPYILGAILVTLVACFMLLYRRRKELSEQPGNFALISREGAFITTNIVLVLLTLIVLIGTVLPRVVELFGASRIAIDRSFFDGVAGPVMLVLVFLMGICPLLGWGRTTWQTTRRNLLWSFLATIVTVVIVAITGMGKWYIIAAAVCGFPVFTILVEWYRGARARHITRKQNYISAFFSLLMANRPRYGGFLVHIGIVLIAMGIIVSSFYTIEKTETLDAGQKMQLGEYELTYDELTLKQDLTRIRATASMLVSKNGQPEHIMYTQNDYWFSHMNSFAEAAVHSTPSEDLFISLVWADFTHDTMSVTIKAMVSPLIMWIWIGGGVLLLGGLVSFSETGKQSQVVRR